MMQITTIDAMLPAIRSAGTEALRFQRSGSLVSSLKADGTVVTEADLAIETMLLEELSERYPQANILTEETERDFDPAKPYIFALDPIDGTEVYNRGMAGWCVSLALMDREWTPLAGVLFAPCTDLLVFADVGRRATVNGAPLPQPDESVTLDRSTNIMVTSRVHRLVDLSRYPGKIRSIGSAALHLAFPAVYADVIAGMQMPLTHVWDIAAAHAVCLSGGYRFEYLNGGRIDYSSLVRGGIAGDVIISGSESALDALRPILHRLD